jgi:GMP synthase (glutamine-hydrolysing)
MQKIAILDYGSQLTHLLATEVRRLNVYSEILDSDTKAEDLKDYIGIILSGGPNSVYEEGAPQVDPAIFDLGLPILGICYGHQLIVQHFGGKVESAGIKEYGKAILNIKQNLGITQNFTQGQDTQVWMSHGDDATILPDGFQVLASTKDCTNAVIGNPQKNIYSLQFHLEVNHTLEGKKMLASFLELCQPDYSWNLNGFLDQKIQEIQDQVQDKKVFLMISGGVDSTVAFALLNKAIGTDRVHGLFVDTGFLRQNEVEQVSTALKSIGVANLHVYSGGPKYFEALKEIYDPEQKRKIIGDLFLDIQAEVSASLNLNPDEWLLGQGTIYPDTIESGGTKNSQKIKTHHNRVERIAELIEQGKIIEPVKDLYKDEVRQIGALLGLPEDMVQRHPFPGPGLAVRALCYNGLGENYAQLRQELDQQEEAINLFLTSHYPTKNLFARIADLKSVGVQGDGRTYRHPLILEADQELEQSNFDFLLDLSTHLTNQFNKINRVILKLSHSGLIPSQPSTKITKLEAIKNKYLSPDRIEVLQKADFVFNTTLKTSGDYKLIWQAPLVLAPLSVWVSADTQTDTQESLILRPISSREAMTADVYPLSVPVISELLQKLEALNLPISGVFYDLTHKPPGTIEWE